MADDLKAELEALTGAIARAGQLHAAATIVAGLHGQVSGAGFVAGDARKVYDRSLEVLKNGL